MRNCGCVEELAQAMAVPFLYMDLLALYWKKYTLRIVSLEILYRTLNECDCHVTA